MQDRRLVLIVQGDGATTNYHMWLETPCDEHAGHVIHVAYPDRPATPIASPHSWVETVLGEAWQDLCFCGASPAPVDAITAMLEATRG